MQGIIRKLLFCKKIGLLHYLYYNYFCKSIVRKDKSKIIPYKNSVIDLEKGAKIVLEGGDIEIGCDLMKGSKEETQT